MSAGEAGVAAAWANPGRLPYALGVDRLAYVDLDEADFLAASFLDGRLLEGRAGPSWAPWAEVESAARVAPRTSDWIFHMGHVGSTLLSRVLGGADGVFALREPAILRELAALAPGTAPDPRLETVLRLLSRVWRPGERSMIKATSFVTSLGPLILGLQPSARALLLYAAPQLHIAGLLAGPGSMRDVSAMTLGRAARLEARLGLAIGGDVEPPGARAALAWACEIVGLADIAAVAPSRVIWLDFDRFLGDPRTGLSRLLSHFGLSASGDRVERLLASPDFHRYAKDVRHPFDAVARRDVLAQALRDHHDEVERGLEWLNRLGSRSPDFAQAARLAAAARAV